MSSFVSCLAQQEVSEMDSRCTLSCVLPHVNTEKIASFFYSNLHSIWNNKNIRMQFDNWNFFTVLLLTSAYRRCYPVYSPNPTTFSLSNHVSLHTNNSLMWHTCLCIIFLIYLLPTSFLLSCLQLPAEWTTRMCKCSISHSIDTTCTCYVTCVLLFVFILFVKRFKPAFDDWINLLIFHFLRFVHRMQTLFPPRCALDSPSIMCHVTCSVSSRDMMKMLSCRDGWMICTSAACTRVVLASLS